MKDRTGFVVLDGVRLLVKVRNWNGNRWVSARSLGDVGAHLVRVEKKLRKATCARKKLQEWKELPV